MVGKEAPIAEVFPGYAWIYLHMSTNTAYDDRAEGGACMALSLGRIMDRIMPHNLLTTIQQGLFHFEFRTYPRLRCARRCSTPFAMPTTAFPAPCN